MRNTRSWIKTGLTKAIHYARKYNLVKDKDPNLDGS